MKENQKLKIVNSPLAIEPLSSSLDTLLCRMRQVTAAP